MENLKEKIEKWWRENRYKFEITEDNGTWLHKIGRILHALFKFTALIPNFRKKYKTKAAKLDPVLAQKLQAKFDFYMREVERKQDSSGFITHETCDATLMSGLLSANPDAGVRLEDARDKKGYWHRRPVESPCYPNGSDSTISRDMMVGIMWYLWEHKKKDLAEDTYNHIKSHNFVMGHGDPARLLMMAGLEATLATIIDKLGGGNHSMAKHQIQMWPKGMHSYHAHLLIMHGLLHGRIHGQIDSKLFEAFKHYAEAEHNRKNPLHAYAYGIYKNGDLNRAAELLMDEKFWPSDRLPQRKDRKNDWITSRDLDDNWQPATSKLEEEHTGGDFLVVAYLILEAYNKTK